jgi:hypothetical protein
MEKVMIQLEATKRKRGRESVYDMQTCRAGATLFQEVELSLLEHL